MSKAMKQIMAGEVREELSGSPNVMVVGLLAMDAGQNLALRNELRAHGARLRVIHNRTSRHALDEARKGVGRYFRGQTAIALPRGSEEELIPVARTLVEAARMRNILELRGGFVDGELLDADGLVALAYSPDKPTMRAMLLGALNGPARGIAAALQGVGGGLARCLQARIDANESNDNG